MTDFDLIARLRDVDEVTIGDARVAADRIEALTKERDREKAYAFQCAINLDTALEQLTAARDDAKEAEAYAEELEAKLAKAVEGQKIKALKQILEERCAVFDAMVDAAEDAAGKDVSFNVVVGRALRAAIAEIKGESHD